MLKVFGAKWCPHCVDTVAYLEKNKIDFQYIDIETQPESVVQAVIQANGGDDWVVPTLEFQGRWREGRVFNEQELKTDLENLGVFSD